MFVDKRRGDIWWMQDTHRRDPETHIVRGDRPVIIVSTDKDSQQSTRVLVVPMSASPAQISHGDGFRGNVLLPGYGDPCVALTNQLRCIDSCDLESYMGHLTDADLARLNAALRAALEL